MKQHYFIPNFRFYNYPYVYAQLFVYALYQTYKREGKDFVPKFKKLLAAGGSISPEELGMIVGLDITKQDLLKIDFKFTINYEPDFANLEFKGNLVIIPEANELKTILKSWKAKKIPNELRLPLINFIMSKCNVKAIPLEEELNLPIHIPMPRLKPSQEGE